MARFKPSAFQTTFQVTLPLEPSEPKFHPRRAHKKSRKGCLICKTRRVKCDERRPACIRCENYGATCVYPSSPTSSRTSSSPETSLTLTPPNKDLGSLSVSETVLKVRDALGSDLAFAPRVIGDFDGVLGLAVDSFQLFLTSSANTVGTPRIQSVMRREMIHVAFDNPYLLYTIIGCGVLHMNRMSPNNEARGLAEAYFWQRALRLYSQALETPVSKNTVNGLISACMLMGVTSLIPPHFEIEDSWVLTGRPSDLNWLAIQGGLAYILKVAKAYVPGSIWGEPFGQNHQVEQKLFQAHIEKGREGLHPELADLCDITDSTGEEIPYWYPLKILTPYLNLEANGPNAALCTTWMGRIEPEFVNMCRDRDQRALVILAYWMGLMCTLSEWQQWVEARLRKECIAVCIYLESYGDASIQPFLRFPATAAGYTLIQDL